jgi:hypothetical protein
MSGGWRPASDRPKAGERVVVRCPQLVRGGVFKGTGVYFGRWDDSLGRWRIEGVPSNPQPDYWLPIPSPPAVTLSRDRKSSVA